MGFWKTILAGIIIAVVSGITLRCSEPVNEWIQNHLGLIYYFIICSAAGIIFGLVVVFIKKIFAKVRTWFANLSKEKREIWKQIADANLTFAALYFEKKDFLIHLEYLGNYFNILSEKEINMNNEILNHIEAIPDIIDECIKNGLIIIQERDFLVSLKKLLDKSKSTKKEIHFSKLNEIFEKLYKHYGKDKIQKAIEEREKEIREGL